MMKHIENVIKPQTKLERTILADPDLQKGLLWGKPRSGHPEGTVLLHVGHVLENVQKMYGNDDDYGKLRLITIIHDSFKYKVDQSKPKAGENHHSRIAWRFAEKYCTDADVLKVIETHDDAYLAFRKSTRKGKWESPTETVKKLITELRDSTALALYVKFFQCDNLVEGKERDSYLWFTNQVEESKL